MCLEISFSSPLIKGYSALDLISEAVKRKGVDNLDDLNINRRLYTIVLNSKPHNQHISLHSISLSSEWHDLCLKTFILCNEDFNLHKITWEPIVRYLRTKPRYFEPGSGMEFLEALADTWVRLTLN